MIKSVSDRSLLMHIFITLPRQTAEKMKHIDYRLNITELCQAEELLDNKNSMFIL